MKSSPAEQIEPTDLELYKILHDIKERNLRILKRTTDRLDAIKDFRKENRARPRT